jgi:hypothetical protein
MAPSSSGPGRQVLILKIRGSTPLGVTTQKHYKETLIRRVSFAILLS